MNRTLTISDRLYEKLRAAAQQQGFRSVEQLLEAQHPPGVSEEELQQRREAVDRVEEIQQRLSAKHGLMPDSVELIREDRGR